MTSPLLDPARRRAVTLTPRDLAILQELAHLRAVPLDVLAARHFSHDPVTGKGNTNPGRACERRLQVLALHGYLWLTAFGDGARQRTVAMLGPAAETFTGRRPGRQRIAPLKRAHHVRTLDALALVERRFAAQGARVTRTRLETELRAAQQSGRFTQAHERFVPCPDAACTVYLEGKPQPIEVAVEYVTSKYTDKDIAAKAAGFRHAYDAVLWFADRPRTATRVAQLTGKTCAVLR